MGGMEKLDLLVRRVELSGWLEGWESWFLIGLAAVLPTRFFVFEPATIIFLMIASHKYFRKQMQIYAYIYTAAVGKRYC